jgi:TonB-like protein
MSELPGQYKVDGDKVSVTAPNWGAVFTQKGNALETPSMGNTLVCTKLSDVALSQIAGSCDEFGRAYNADNICFDTRPTLILPQTTGVHVGDKVVEVTVEVSEAKGGSALDPRGFARGGWRPDQAQGALALPTPADASVAPTPELLLLRVSRDGVTDTAKVLFSSIYVKTFADAAMDMARSLRWHPARKHGEAVQAWVQWEFRPVTAGAYGFISVNVTGAPARPNGLPAVGPVVWIDDDILVGRTPVINCQVRAGRHTIRLQVGSRVVSDTVQVDSGATVVKSYAWAQR